MRGMEKAGLTAAYIAALALCVGSAYGADLTGTWKGKRTCKGVWYTGEKVRDSFPIEYKISQKGIIEFGHQQIYMSESSIAPEGNWIGTVLDYEPPLPITQGGLGLAACSNDGLVGPGGSNALEVAASGSYVVGATSGKIRLTQIIVSYYATTICKITLSRSSTDDPGVVSCP